METLDPITLVGLIIPLLVGVLAKLRASSRLKAILNLGLSALASLLAQVVPDQPFAWTPFLVTFVITWVISIASYYGFWKPTSTAQVVQVKTARFGFGSEVGA